MVWVQLFSRIRETAMLRSCLLLLGALVATTSAGGCRSCSSGHDYDPPVANCHCNACGTHRAGSASGEMVDPEYADEGYYGPQRAYDETGEENLPPHAVESPTTDQPARPR
jgi:hypothetical protein